MPRRAGRAWGSSKVGQLPHLLWNHSWGWSWNGIYLDNLAERLQLQYMRTSRLQIQACSCWNAFWILYLLSVLWSVVGEAVAQKSLQFVNFPIDIYTLCDTLLSTDLVLKRPIADNWVALHCWARLSCSSWIQNIIRNCSLKRVAISIELWHSVVTLGPYCFIYGPNATKISAQTPFLGLRPPLGSG